MLCCSSNSIIDDYFNNYSIPIDFDLIKKMKKYESCDQFMFDGLFQYQHWENIHVQLINVPKLIQLGEKVPNSNMFTTFKEVYNQLCHSFYNKIAPKKIKNEVIQFFSSLSLNNEQRKELILLSDYMSFYILNSRRQYKILDYPKYNTQTFLSQIKISRELSVRQDQIKFKTQSLRDLYQPINYTELVNLNQQGKFKTILDDFSIVKTSDQTQIDHIYPISKGGLNSLANLQMIPQRLNSQKQDSIEITDGMYIQYNIQQQIFNDHIQKNKLFYNNKYFIGDLRLIFMNQLSRNDIVLIFSEILTKLRNETYDQQDWIKRIIISNLYIMSIVDQSI